MNDTDKEALIAAMLAVAGSDGSFDDVESNQIVLNAMQERLGITEDKFREIVNKFLTITVTQGLAKVAMFARDNVSATYRNKAFHYAVDVAVCNDGILGENQQQVLDYLAAGWGVSDGDKASAITEAKKKYL